MNKFLILMIFLVSISAQQIFAQSVRPLGITIETTTNYDEAEWRWTPVISFRAVGPIEEGGQVSVEYTFPNGKPFVTAKCDTNPLPANENRRFDVCGRNLEGTKAINQTGLFGFQIKLGNALTGTNKILYSGKFKIGRFLYNLDGVPEKNKQFHYFVDNDFRLGYAFVGTWSGDLSNDLYVELWLKNQIMNYANINGYLFYNGKQVGETSPSYRIKLFPKENPKEYFELLGLQFRALMDKPPSDGMNDWFKVFENPGEYEVKLMREKKLVRSIKFSVGANGKFVANNIGRDLVGGTDILVPAQILGDSDGVYNKTAWKDGIWGNPISNLIVP